VLIWIAVMHEAGGFTASLAAVDPERFQPFASGGRSWIEVIEEWAIPVTGSMLAAEILQRMIAARSPGAAKWGTLGGAALYVLIGLIPVYLGLAGPALLPGLDQPEQLVPSLAQRYLGPVAYVLFAGALVSIILSTVDSALLAAGGLVSHNLVAPVLRLGDRGRLLAARLSVLGFGVVATLLALGADTVYDLVETASAFGSTGVFVVSLFALFTRIGGPAAAYASLGTGLGVWAWGVYVAGWTAPYLTSLAVALAAYLLVAGLESRRPRPAAGIN
jgi:Na+/proline symporter